MNRQFRRKLNKKNIQKNFGANSNYLHSNHINLINDVISNMKPLYTTELDNLSIQLITTLEDIFYNSYVLTYSDTWSDINNPIEDTISIDSSMVLTTFIEYINDTSKPFTLYIYKNFYDILDFLETQQGDSAKHVLVELLYKDYTMYTEQLSFADGKYAVEGKFTHLFMSLHHTIIKCIADYLCILTQKITTYMSVQYNSLSHYTDDKIIHDKCMDSLFNDMAISSGLVVAKKIMHNIAVAKSNDFISEYNFLVSIVKILLKESFVNIFPTALEECLDYFIQEVIGLQTKDYTEYNSDIINTSELVTECCSNIDSNFTEGIFDTNDRINKLKYIDKYKDLNKLAIDSGFTYIRSHGDHGIYQNSSGNTVIIPQGRTIGKGLSFAIQSQLVN